MPTQGSSSADAQAQVGHRFACRPELPAAWDTVSAPPSRSPMRGPRRKRDQPGQWQPPATVGSERAVPSYRATCERCGADLFVTERVGDPEIRSMLRHLWTADPDVVQEPAVLPLADLMRLVRVRMA